MTIHDMPAAAWDAWHEALGTTPVEVSPYHHKAGIYLDKPLGAVVFENHRYVPDPNETGGEAYLYIRGRVFRRVQL